MLPTAGARSLQLLLLILVTPLVSFGHSDGEDLRRAHHDDGHRTAIVEGRILDRDSGSPVENALVELSVDKRKYSGSTDSQGAFSFLLQPEAIREHEDGDDEDWEHDAASLAIVANLYRTARLRVHLHEHKPTALEVRLNRKPASEIAEVRGTITSSDNDLGVPGAEVSILGGGGVLTTTTGNDGSFEIAGVGFNQDLTVQVITHDPPCMEATSRSLQVGQTTVVENIAVAPLKLPVVHCPLRPFGPVTGGGPVNLPSDSAIRWHQADLLSIQMSAEADSWNAGHVADILKFEPGGGMLAATDTGGVWAITSIGQAIPLSDSWPASSMTSMAPGPDGPRHVYAATYRSGGSPGGVLWETDTSTGFPTLNWMQVNQKPPCNQINKVLVISEARRIVLACDTGVYWSQIPAAPSVHGTYSWNNATPAQVQQGRAFSGLAKGPGWNGGEGTIVASKWGGAAPGQAIYNGRWSSGTLQLGFSTVDQGPGNLFLIIGRTSLASCPSDPRQMFALAETGTGSLAGVWKSGDAGVNWSMVSLPENPGTQGNYNNVIAMSPDCRIVALGWEAGTFVSYDAGGSWTLLRSDDRHLHGDVHALTFDPADPTTLFIGSDGGVASASGLGPDSSPTYASNWNRQLFNLQLYHGDGSSAASGLVAAGAQDNGVIWAALPGPWQHLTSCGCDGRWSRFLTPPSIAPGNSILLEEEWGFPDWPFDWITANGTSISGATQHVPVSPPNPQWLTNVVTELVRAPRG